jgi:hypothetical protein
MSRRTHYCERHQRQPDDDERAINARFFTAANSGFGGVRLPLSPFLVFAAAPENGRSARVEPY